MSANPGDAGTALRRDGDRELPAGPKAQRTREAILVAAATCFAAQGYAGTTVADIATAAGVSLGTVYQYFRDRADLVAALVNRAMQVMFDRADPTYRVAEGEDGLHRIILSFVTSYTEVAALAGVWEEVTHIDEQLADLRRGLGRAFTGRVERELRRAAAAGEIRTDLDVDLAARALTAMVDRYCYVTYVFDPPARVPSVAKSATVLTKLWSAAIAP
jgi:AcrR family transcriptional regulator